MVGSHSAVRGWVRWGCGKDQKAGKRKAARGLCTLNSVSAGPTFRFFLRFQCYPTMYSGACKAHAEANLDLGGQCLENKQDQPNRAGV